MLPLCSGDECPNYDGKRCKAMGFRPDRFCEPELIHQVELMAWLQGGGHLIERYRTATQALPGLLERAAELLLRCRLRVKPGSELERDVTRWLHDYEQSQAKPQSPPQEPGPLLPRAVCTHPSFDKDGRCHTCGDVVALGFPEEFAKFNAEMFSDESAVAIKWARCDEPECTWTGPMSGLRPDTKRGNGIVLCPVCGSSAIDENLPPPNMGLATWPQFYEAEGSMYVQLAYMGPRLRIQWSRGEWFTWAQTVATNGVYVDAPLVAHTQAKQQEGSPAGDRSLIAGPGPAVASTPKTVEVGQRWEWLPDVGEPSDPAPFTVRRVRGDDVLVEGVPGDTYPTEADLILNEAKFLGHEANDRGASPPPASPPLPALEEDEGLVTRVKRWLHAWDINAKGTGAPVYRSGAQNLLRIVSEHLRGPTRERGT